MGRSYLTRRNAVLLATGAGLLVAGFSVTLSTDRALEYTTETEARVSPVASTVAPVSAPEAVAAGLGSEWDLPNLDHPRIDYWIDRFENVPEMRKKFQGFLDRGGPLAPMILERLEARGMPQDLLYLAMIESGFQPNATSHAAAVGVWQFIRETGERYGLEVDRAVDERRDPVRATEAALDYLQALHDRFGSWYLAAAAYNTGEGRVGRAMRAEFGRERARSESEYYRIWDRLPRETRDYVPLMIAAARITKDPESYGFRPLRPAPIAWDEITVAPATQLGDVAAMYGTTVSELKQLNPHFKLSRTPNDRDYPVRLPAGSLERYAQARADRANVAD
ncbi:MAG TPA: lytic transglycosylase domain-containing protein [Longimicrobiales bacterium]